MRSRKIVLMAFGLGGNHYELEGGNSSGSWYLKAHELGDYVDRADGYGYKAGELEGAILLDKVPAIEACGAGVAIASPLVDVGLEPGAVDRFADIPGVGDSMVLRAFADGDGVQRGLAAMAVKSLVDATYSGLDRVALDLFVQWWHARGARVGRFVGGRVLWD